MSMQSEINTFLGLLGIAGQPLAKQRLENKARIQAEKRDLESLYKEADALKIKHSLADTKEKQDALEPEFDRIHAKGALRFDDEDFEVFSDNLGNIYNENDKKYKPMKELIEEQRKNRNAEAVRKFARGEER